jgi:glycosyltransferase involved in cell wall biosynthesis
VSALRRSADLAVFHEFQPPPYGGGNQFLIGLVRTLEDRGVRVERNAIPPGTAACLFNSYNFDFARLEAFRRDDCRLVHRIDGPLLAYRGFDDGTDARIADANARFADATILQSRWSLEHHRTLGIELRDPHVIPNAVDPRIFHRDGRAAWDGARPLRVISVSWSDNENKGGETYRWLDDQLDPHRYAYTFVGRTKHPLRHGRTLPPLPSDELAHLLREHDVFVTASKNDPCSNALLEALACGLPALYLRSGGHPELAGEGGFGFDDREEIPALLDRLRDEYPERQARISVPSLDDVVDEYLGALGLEQFVRAPRGA